MPEENDDLIAMMRERVETQKEKRNWTEAESAANTTVDTFKERYDEDPEKIGDYARALEIKANLYRDLGDQNQAQELYGQIIDLLENSTSYQRICGRVGANLAIIYEDQEMLEDARNFYCWSLENFEVADPPMPLEMAGVLNNLAFLYERQHYLEEAEDLFMRALKINKQELGTKNESTADVWNNLGGLYYRSGKFPQALEMHKMALEIREDVLGKDHFDTAQSYGNLALAYAEVDKIDLAKESFDNALKILEKSKEEGIGDYAIISSNFVHILKELGHPKDAEKIEKRTTKYMKKLH